MQSSGPLLAVVETAGGVPTRLFSVIALIAVANGALLTGIMSSRLAYGMARDGLLPRFLTRVLPGRRTPWAAIATTALLSLLLAVTGDVAALASTLVLLLLVVFLLVNTAVLRLRGDTVPHDHYRTPRIVALLGAASCVLLATRIEGAVWGRGLIVLAVGVLLAWVAARRRMEREGRRKAAPAGRGVRAAGPRPVPVCDRARLRDPSTGGSWKVRSVLRPARIRRGTEAPDGGGA